MKIRFLLIVFLISYSTLAQESRWQQRVEYTMDVQLDVRTHKIAGTQKVVYYNNSPDTLSKVYYLLSFVLQCFPAE
jgi:hypothetical protein